MATSAPSTLDDFVFLSRLGKGSFGEVHKVRRNADGQIYVIKKVNITDMSTQEQLSAVQEVNIMASLDSSYVVRYYDSFLEYGTLCIVMEYCDRGDLQMMIKKQSGMPLPEDRIWRIFLQAALGVEHLHSRRILHRDIKCANIFLCSGDKVKIGDLGVARVLGSESFFAKTVCGTPYFLSPELVEGHPYNEKSDIWALGCVLYELCTRRHAFNASNQAALMFRIIRGEYPPIPEEYSPILHRLIASMLTRDSDDRPSIWDILTDDEIYAKCLENKLILPASVAKRRVSPTASPAESPESRPEAFSSPRTAEIPAGSCGHKSCDSSIVSEPIVADDLHIQDWHGHEEDIAALAMCDRHRFEEELHESIHIIGDDSRGGVVPDGTLRRPVNTCASPAAMIESPYAGHRGTGGLPKPAVTLLPPGSCPLATGARPLTAIISSAPPPVPVIRPGTVGSKMKNLRVRKGDPTGGLRVKKVLPLSQEAQAAALAAEARQGGRPSSRSAEMPAARTSSTSTDIPARPTPTPTQSPSKPQATSMPAAIGPGILISPSSTPVATETAVRTADALARAASRKSGLSVRHLHALQSDQVITSVPSSPPAKAEPPEEYEDDFEPDTIVVAEPQNGAAAAANSEADADRKESIAAFQELYRQKSDVLDSLILRARTFVSQDILDNFLTLKDAEDSETQAQVARLKPQEYLLIHKIQSLIGELDELDHEMRALEGP